MQANPFFCSPEFLDFSSKLKDAAAAHKRRLDAAVPANVGAVMGHLGNALVSCKPQLWLSLNRTCNLPTPGMTLALIALPQFCGMSGAVALVRPLLFFNSKEVRNICLSHADVVHKKNALLNRSSWI
jgi:hypothetical protein